MGSAAPLIPADRIRQRVNELAAQISSDYAGKELDVVCLLNAASVFAADLVRALTIPARLHFLGFTSYPRGSDSGEVRITLDVTEPLMNRHVLVVEGVVVSGRTPRYILDILSLRRPASLTLCALGVKRALLSVSLPLTYVGFELGDDVAAGYGMGSGVEKTRGDIVSITP